MAKKKNSKKIQKAPRGDHDVRQHETKFEARQAERAHKEMLKNRPKTSVTRNMFENHMPIREADYLGFAVHTKITKTMTAEKKPIFRILCDAKPLKAVIG